MSMPELAQSAEVKLPSAEAYPLKEILKPQHTALLVIDLQNDFCDPKGKFATDYHKDVAPMHNVLSHNQRLIEQAHAAGVPVIYTLGYEDIDLRDEPGKWRYTRHETEDGVDVNSKKGTWGAKFADGIQPQPGDLVLEKHDWSAFSGRQITNFLETDDPYQYVLGEDLQQILKEKGVETLVVTGVKTEICVDSSVTEAKQKHFFVVVPKEAVGTDDLQAHDVFLRIWDFRNGGVVSENEVIENWPPAKKEEPTP